MALDQEQMEGLADFRMALRRFLSASEMISRQVGMTQQQYQALLAIRVWPDERMQIRDLAAQLLLTHHAAVQLANRLEAGGLAQRAPSPDDRRSVLLRLTAEGVARIDDLAERHLAAMLRQEPLLSQSLRQLSRMQRS